MDDVKQAEKENKKVAIYFHDEAGFSLTTDIGYTWFKEGQRPEIKASVSRSYWHLSTAADPETGDIFSILVGWLNTETFQQFLDEFAKHVEKKIQEGYEIWLTVDKAGWHLAKEIQVPNGIKLVVMPTGAAMINPIETLWEFIRKNFTRCKVHNTLEELANTLCKACRHLINSAKAVMSICHTSMVTKCTLV